MSDRDRSNQERGFDNPSRRDGQSASRQTSTPPPRNRSFSEDDEYFDLPEWTEPSPRASNRDTSSKGSSSRQSGQGTGSSRSTSRREPIPELGDAFKSSGRKTQSGQTDQAPAGSQEPYDRLRRVASKPQRPVEFDEDGFEIVDDYEDDYGRYEPAPRGREQRGRGSRGRTPAPSTRQPGPPRTPATQQIGGLISSAAPQTRFMAAVLGIGLISIVFMLATVAGRIGSLPDWIPIHLNAEGTPDTWGTSSTLWRIPMIVFFSSLMSVAIAWAVGKRDAFAVRFALGSTLLIHALCWIALVNLAW